MYKTTLALFSILISLALSSCKNKIESTTPEIKNITESVYSSGYIKSKNQYEVFGKPNNIVKEIFVTEGTPVQKGSPIFQMENNTQQLSTENARLASIAADFRINNSKLRDGKKRLI
jgi:multidrug efflux pump subunit AcrA (membrane-fusion protein)